MAKLWSDIAGSKDFTSLSDADKDVVRESFFERVVAPEVAPDQVDATRERFNSASGYRRRELPAGVEPSKGRGMDALGAAAGPPPDVDAGAKPAPPPGQPDAEFVRQRRTRGGVASELRAPGSNARADFAATDPRRIKAPDGVGASVLDSPAGPLPPAQPDPWAADRAISGEDDAMSAVLGQRSARQAAVAASQSPTGPTAQRRAEAAAELERRRVVITGTIRDAGPRSATADALTSFDQKPLDQSLGGEALEVAGDALRGLTKTGPGLAKAAYGVVRAAAEVSGMERIADWAKHSAAAGNDYLAQLDNPNGDKLVTGAFQSLGTAALGGAAAGASGAIALMVGQTAGDKYDELRNHNIPIVAALEGSMVHGVAEYVGERTGMKSLGRLVEGVASKTGLPPIQVLKEALKQQGEEQVTLAIQTLYDKLGSGSVRQGMTLDDYLEDVVNTAAQTAIMTAAAGGGGALARVPAKVKETYSRADAAKAYGTASAKGFNVEPPLTTDTPDVQRKKTNAIFDAVAASVGIGGAAIKRAKEAAEGLPLAKVGAFYKRFADSLGRRGLTGGPIEPEFADTLDAGVVEPPPEEAKPAKAAAPAAAEAKTPQLKAVEDMAALLGVQLPTSAADTPAAPLDTDLTTADEQPYGTKASAHARATREGGGEVVEVAGGWVVRPEDEDYTGLADVGQLPDEQRQSPRAVEDAGVRLMDGNEGSLSQPEERLVLPVRGARDQGLPGVGRNLQGVPGGHGREAITETQPGQISRPERGLQAGQLPVGDTSATDAQQEEQQAGGGNQRSDPSVRGSGARSRDGGNLVALSPQVRGEDGRSADEANRQGRPHGQGSDSVERKDAVDKRGGSSAKNQVEHASQETRSPKLDAGNGGAEAVAAPGASAGPRVIAHAGNAPKNATPLELRAHPDGTLALWWDGGTIEDPATLKPLTVPANSTNAQAIAALKASGALGKKLRPYNVVPDLTTSTPAAPAVPGESTAVQAPDASTTQVVTSSKTAPAEAPQAAPERRTDAAARKRVADMAPDELRAALHTDDLTGLHNDRWLREHEGEFSHIVAFDADSLKWVNDNLGHESGDELLKAWGEALRRTSDTAVRAGGDEFFALANSQADADRITAEVQRILGHAVITATTPTGEVTITGVGVSFGVGADRRAADERLNQHKQARQAAGTRAGRGEEPPGTSRRSAAGQQDQERAAAAEEVAGDPAPTPESTGVEAQWTRMPSAERRAVAARAGFAPMTALVSRPWGDIKPAHQNKLAAAIDGSAAVPAPEDAPSAPKPDKAEMRPFRRADGSVGYEAVPIVAAPAAAPAEDLDAMFERMLKEKAAAKAAAAAANAPPTAPKKPRKPATPQIANEPGVGYVLPGFVTAGAKKLPRTAGAAAASAAVNTAKGVKKGLDGLAALFGGDGKLGSGLSFDEDTYAKAKPMFLLALGDLKTAAADLGEAMSKVVDALLDIMGPLGVKRMQPYVVRFIGDVRDGKVELAMAHTAEQDANNANQPNRRDPGAVDDGQEPGDRTPVADGEPGGAGPDQALAGQPPADGGAPGAPADPAADGTRPVAPDVPGGEGEQGSGDGADGRSGASGEGLAADGTGAGGLAGPARPNFHVADPASLIGGTPKVRFARNRAALEALDAITSEGRTPLPAELDAMAAYIGWGSFGQDLFNGSWDRPRPKKSWEKEDEWLRQRLGKEAWQSAQASIINAHYTDPITVGAMWDMMRAMGFTGGRVLEPSLGIGNFYGLMPRDLMERSQLTGIELEQTTGAMAQLLYPEANIQIKGYQDSQTADGFYDLVVGNWPFAAEGPPGVRRYAALNPSLHDFFFLKALDQTRAGGIVMGITSTGTMDKKGRATRMEIAKKGELLAAFRLPSGAFEQYAGTAVVTDILILRKRAAPLADPQSERWIELGDFHPTDGPKFQVNQYFLDHPENVLGTLNWGDHTTIGRPGMVVDRPDNLQALLGELAGRMPLAAYQPRTATSDALVAYVSNNTADRQGAVTLNDKGSLFVVRGDQLAPLADVVKYRVKDAKENVRRDAQLKALIGLRRAYGALIDGERAGVANVDPLRTTLRTQYEAFVKKFGLVNDSEGLAILKKVRDPFYSTLAALEHKGQAATILSRSTMRATRKLDNPSVRDAFVTARNESLTLDLAKIAAATNKTEAQVIAELEKTDAIYRTPAGNYEVADVYLSGNVRRKAHEVDDAIASGQQGLQRNLDALNKVMPKTQPYFQIEAKLGAPWVTHEQYRQFVAELLGVWGKPGADDIAISFVNGSWKVRFAHDVLNGRPEATTQWGMPRSVIRFDKLITAALNNRPVTIKYKDSDGITFVHEKETTQSNERITLMREEFSQWVWRDPERRVWLETNYNEVMNAVANPHYDGDFLDFPGMALQRGTDPFSLRKHQSDAIWRGLVNGSGLYAHEVGTGKTFTMAGLAVESRRYGLAQKPLVFAHNANSGTVAREFNDMYPGAKVLYIDNLTPDTIDLTMRKIANDDWDAVVVPHSLIDRFALKQETLDALVAQDIAALEQEALDAADEDHVALTAEMMDDPDQMKKVRSATAKELVKARNQIKKKVADMVIRSSREGAIAFEDLGVDMVIVDEAHEFKKPPLVTKMKMKGLNTATSNRSIALRFLTDYVKGQRNGRGIFTFTGTPITNTLAEIYNQMRYVMDDQMKRDGIKDWDTWFASFADSATNVEITTSGEHEPVTTLSAFVNVAELRRIAGQYMDIVFADDMPEFKPRPTASGKIASDPSLTEAERNQLLTSRSEKPVGRPYKRTITETAAMSNAQALKHAEIRELASLFKNASKKGRRDMMASGHPASPVLLETTASNVGLDMRLIDLQADDVPESKVNRAVRNVMRHYKEHPLATQAIFLERGYSDFGVSVKTGLHGVKVKTRRAKFNLVRDIVDKLVEQGIPSEQIVVVDGSMSKEARKAAADAMNEGTVRVVIGLTSTLGTGVNMQNNLRAMHHLDAPWMPGELEQRNGRGWRQGNKWDTVFEYRYVTEGLDGKRWQVLRRKAHIIEAFLKADENQRVIDDEAAGMDDEGNALDATLAEAAGDPRLLTRAKLAADVHKLETRERMHTIGVAEAKAKARQLRESRGDTDKQIANLQVDVDTYAAGRAAPFAATVAKAAITERSAFDAALTAHALATIHQDDKATLLGRVYGFNVYGLWPRFAGGIVFEVGGANLYESTGSLASIEAVLRNLTKRLADATARGAESVLSAARMDEAAKLPFQQAQALVKKRAMLEDLERDLQLNPTPSPAWLRNGATVGSPVWVDGDRVIVEGHRWSADGYFVITAEGDVPYLDVKDENGFPIYEDHNFRPPIQSLAGMKLTDTQGRQVEVLRGPFGEPPAPQRLFIKRVNDDGKEVKEEVLASTINMPLRVNKQRPYKNREGGNPNLRQTGVPAANETDLVFADIRRRAVKHTLPKVAIEHDDEGVPTFNGDLVALAYPQPTERFEIIPGPGQQVMNYAIVPPSGFGVLGHVELLLDKGKVVSLLDIVIDKGDRRAGVGRSVVETLLAAQPGIDLNISNVVESARDFWEKIGIPVQNLEAGAAYDGTLNSQTYQDLLRPGKLARVGEQLARQGYQKADVPRVQAARALQKLIDEHAAGTVTDGAFIMRTKVLADRMATVVETKAANRGIYPRVRDVDHVRAKLLEARRSGDLDPETVAFALWALDKNPSLAANLGIKIVSAGEDTQAGDYNPAAEIMRLFKGAEGSTETAVHEILHHAERMMPPDMQAAIRKEWARALSDAIKKGTPEQVEALKDIALSVVGDKAAYARLVKAIQEGPLNYEQHYPLINPSEFWAVNGARLLGQHHAAKDSVWERIRVWLRELVQKARALSGLSSTAQIIRALHYVTDASHFGVERGGRFESPSMLSERAAVATMQDIQPGTTTVQTPSGSVTTTLHRSPWLDPLNRLQFAPGAWLAAKMGEKAGPLLARIGLKPISKELAHQLRAMKLQVQKAQETAAAISTTMHAGFSEDERNMVSDIVEQELAAGVTPPAHAIQMAALMSATFTAQSRELVDLGMLSEQAATRWDGKYLPRFYSSKLRKQAGDAWADAVRRMTGRTSVMKGVRGNHLKMRGLPKTIDVAELPDFLALGWEVRDPGYVEGESKQVQVWRDWTREERDARGEIRDANFRFVMGYMQTQRDLALGRMFAGMATDPAQSARLKPEDKDWVLVPRTHVEGTGINRYGKLSGRYVPRETLSHLSQIEEADSAAWQMYRKGMGIWKEGKALALDTLIPTPTGWTTMGAIEIGDTVFDESGHPCEVTFATPVQLERECFEVEFSDGEKIVADAEHLWFTVYHGKGSAKTTRQILDTLKERTRGDNNHSIPVAGALQMADAHLPIPPYAFGAWLGDGTSGGASICAGAADADEMAAHVRESGVAVGAYSVDKRNGVVTFGIRYTDASLKRCDGLQPTLRNMGVLGNKHIPAVYLRASETQRRDLLCGLMDTDGHITEAGKCEFSTTSPQLRDGTMELLRSLGYKPVAGEYRALIEGRDCGASWRIKFQAYGDSPVFKMARKVARLREAPQTRQRSGTRQIVAITPVPSVPVRCIQVSAESRLYLAGAGMVPTHNTALNPASHMNNTVGNTIMAHIAGVGLHRADKYVAAAKDFIWKAPMVKEAQDAGLFLGGFNAVELLDSLPPELKELVAKADSRTAAGAKLAYNALTLGLRKPLGALYGAEDSFFRYLLYKDARSRGVAPNEAVDHAQRFIFTYDDLPGGARKIRDFGIPFFAYTYKAFPVMISTALTHPVRFGAAATLIWVANAAAYAIAAGDEDDEWQERLRKYATDAEYRKKVLAMEEAEQAHLPPWQRGLTAMFTRKVIRLGTDSLTKLPLFIDVSRMIPGNDLANVTPHVPGAAWLPQPLTPSHPVFSLAVGMMANTDLWTGKLLVDSNDTTGEAFNKRADWIWKLVAPALAPGGAHYDRAMDAWAQANGGEIPWVPEFISEDRTGINKMGQPVQPGYAALQTVGIKVRPVDLEVSERIDEAKQRQLVREIMAELRKDKRMEMVGAIKPEVFERRRAAAREKIDRVRAGLTVDGGVRP